MSLAGLSFSREQKNSILILVNLLAFVIYSVKIWRFDTPLSLAETIWILVVLPVVALNALPILGVRSRRFGHALLYLCTGGIFGITLGAVLLASETLIFLDYIWLIIAFVAVIIHYSKSKTDIYRNR